MQIVVTIEEIEARLPEVARWRALFNRLAAVAPVGATPEQHLDTLLQGWEIQHTTPPTLTEPVKVEHVVPTEPTTEARLLDLYHLAFVSYKNSPKRWLTVQEAATILNLSPTTVRHYAEIGVTSGDLVTKVGELTRGQRGRRPRLYSYNPKRAEVPHEQRRHLEDQETSRPR